MKIVDINKRRLSTFVVKKTNVYRSIDKRQKNILLFAFDDKILMQKKIIANVFCKRQKKRRSKI